MTVIEQCAKCCREQFGHRPVQDWWEQMHQGAREHWIAGTNAVLAEFARLAQSPEMVEKIARRMAEQSSHVQICKEHTKFVLVALFRETGVIS
jgi:hypothetical protein